MNERKTVFFLPMSRSSRSVSCSPLAAGRSSGLPRRIAAGTVASISASSESKPSERTITAASAGFGPRSRRGNESVAASGSGGVEVGVGEVDFCCAAGASAADVTENDMKANYGLGGANQAHFRLHLELGRSGCVVKMEARCEQSEFF